MRPLLIILICLYPLFSAGQWVNNVRTAFNSLSAKPKVITIQNVLEVPLEQGHLQGVQVVNDKLLISGSSLNQAYLLQVDLASKKAEKLIPLMEAPYRHAGGLQASEEYLAVGIEDNFNKNVSKVCVYPLEGEALEKATPLLVIERGGKPERNTAGATGILASRPGQLVVVGDWDSRNWDFYQCSPMGGHAMQVASYTVPEDWPAYQSINLIADDEAIYAIGFYGSGQTGSADLILVSKPGVLELIMEKVAGKTFDCSDKVDFQTVAGLQVDQEGKIHVWATQRDALKQIVVNTFSQR